MQDTAGGGDCADCDEHGAHHHEHAPEDAAGALDALRDDGQAAADTAGDGGHSAHGHDDLHGAPALLDALSVARFAEAVPVPQRLDATDGGALALEMRRSEQWLGLSDAEGNPLQTAVWGFGVPGEAATWPGPTVLARSGVPLSVEWRNALPREGPLLPVDAHLAHGGGGGGGGMEALADGLVPTVVHLHGAHTDSASDGLPEAWFTQDPSAVGPDYQGNVATYPNDQGSAALWYHDHAMALTRTSVYAGLAGFYLLGDAAEDDLIGRGVLPGRDAEVELAIQDRAFTADGQLYYPAHPGDPLPGTDETVADTLPEGYGGPVPTVVPEFFGDVLLVNGMAWPTLALDPGAERLRLLNGSDSRVYVLELDNPWAKLTLVGNDGGLLPRALAVSDGDGVQEADEFLVLAPGDRVDLVLDTSDPHLRGESVTLLNRGPAYEPFKGLAPDGTLAPGDEGPVAAAAPDDPVGAVMRFDVGAEDLLDNGASVEDGTVLDPGYVELRPEDATTVRRLGLFEVEDEHGRTTPMLGVAEDGVTDAEGRAVPFGPLPYGAPATEVIRLGATEVWNIANFSEDAHPVHLHQVRFQVLERAAVEWEDDLDNAAGAGGPDGVPDGASPGEAIASRPEDQGWQDTVWVGPGESLSIIARFDLPGEYVWHCHILSHEDHDMMRPFVVADAPLA